MNAHPRDEWVEFRGMGDTVPVPFLVVDGREVEIAEAKALYIADRITVDELERRVHDALTAKADPEHAHLCVDNDWRHGRCEACDLCLEDLRQAGYAFDGPRAL